MTLEIFVIGNLEKDFLKRRNRAMKKSHADLVMLLNTDIEVSGYQPSIKLFEKDPNLFAVTFSPSSSQSGKTIEAKYANGGSSIYRRDIWNKIGGIDMIFEPYWWDDVDYSLRAKKAGYHILEDGRITVVQKSKMGTDILKRNLISVLVEKRNYVLYLMKHDKKELEKVKWHPKIAFFYIWAKWRFNKFYPNA